MWKTTAMRNFLFIPLGDEGANWSMSLPLIAYRGSPWISPRNKTKRRMEAPGGPGHRLLVRD